MLRCSGRARFSDFVAFLSAGIEALADERKDADKRDARLERDWNPQERAKSDRALRCPRFEGSQAEGLGAETVDAARPRNADSERRHSLHDDHDRLAGRAGGLGDERVTAR